jgi:hypothetical protein
VNLEVQLAADCAGGRRDLRARSDASERGPSTGAAAAARGAVKRGCDIQRSPASQPAHRPSGEPWSIKKFVRTARRYRTVQIRAAGQTLAAADALPDDLHEAIAKINASGSAH